MGRWILLLLSRLIDGADILEDKRGLQLLRRGGGALLLVMTAVVVAG